MTTVNGNNGSASSAAYVLHHSAHERRALMLEKLGGNAKLREANNIFYNRQMNDERLVKFFKGTNIEILKWHQLNLMSIAFTSVPDEKKIDIRELILGRHTKLFEHYGLSEYYYDLVLEHFVETLKSMDVDQALITETLEVVKPLRKIFEEGAALVKQRKQAKEQRKQQLAVIASATVVAAGVFGIYMLRSSKKR